MKAQPRNAERSVRLYRRESGRTAVLPVKKGGDRRPRAKTGPAIGRRIGVGICS